MSTPGPTNNDAQERSLSNTLADVMEKVSISKSTNSQDEPMKTSKCWYATSEYNVVKMRDPSIVKLVKYKPPATSDSAYVISTSEECIKNLCFQNEEKCQDKCQDGDESDLRKQSHISSSDVCNTQTFHNENGNDFHNNDDNHLQSGRKLNCLHQKLDFKDKEHQRTRFHKSKTVPARYPARFHHSQTGSKNIMNVPASFTPVFRYSREPNLLSTKKKQRMVKPWSIPKGKHAEVCHVALSCDILKPTETTDKGSQHTTKTVDCGVQINAQTCSVATQNSKAMKDKQVGTKVAFTSQASLAKPKMQNKLVETFYN